MSGRRNGILWAIWAQLDDLDFADDVFLLSHTHAQAQMQQTQTAIKLGLCTQYIKDTGNQDPL